jgi:hypothetical protein
MCWTIYNKFNKRLKQTSVLVVGNYQQTSIGDEMYKSALKQYFTDADFMSIDHLNNGAYLNEHDLSRYQCVLYGGGELNETAGTALSDFLKRVRIPCYAISISLERPQLSHFLHMFDHVVARNAEEAEIAAQEIGKENVTCLPDLCFSLMPNRKLKRLHGGLRDTGEERQVKIAVCLSRTLLQRVDEDIKYLGHVLNTIGSALQAEFYLLAFNTNPRENEASSDIWLNDQLSREFEGTHSKLFVVNPDIVYDYLSMCHVLSNMDFVICGRYHSVVLAMMLRKPFVVIQQSRKTSALLGEHNLSARDIGCSASSQYFDCLNAIVQNMQITPHELLPKTNADVVAKAFSMELTHLISKKKRKVLNQLCIANNKSLMHSSMTFRQKMTRCGQLLSRYLKLEERELADVVSSPAYAKAIMDKERSDSIARIITYSITENLTSYYMWLIVSNLDPSKILHQMEAINLHYTQSREREEAFDFALDPRIQNLELRHFVDMYAFCQFDSWGSSPSGWNHVLSALHRFEANMHHRCSDVIIDTYVDRTFHWGEEVLLLAGHLPYSKPWMGFIHHSFNTSVCLYNSDDLFTKVSFRQSLPCCKGLMVMSKTMRQKMESKLRENGFGNIPVFVINYCTETPVKKFSLLEFIRNSERRVLQISAWLRNPYAIYELPISKWNNRLQLRKTILNGRGMSGLLSENAFVHWLEQQKQNGRMNAAESTGHGTQIQSNHETKKYVSGMINMLHKQTAEVEILEKVTPKYMDELLSSNVVFLHLIDAASVNPVMECIVRNTPFIVNRLPALEEVLGKHYPGFYEDFNHAAYLAENLTSIVKIHMYLKWRVSKRAFKQMTFARRFRKALDTLDRESPSVRSQEPLGASFDAGKP